MTIWPGSASRARSQRISRHCATSRPTCWWQQTFPGSHFRKSLTCSISTSSGRITLSGDRLIVTEDGHRQEQTLTSDAEILDAYRRYFGITLDRVPVIDAD
jgi:N-hydroxyarylamine O-acetyltransferase